MPYADPVKRKEYHKRKSAEWVKDFPKKRAKIAHTYWQSEKGKTVKRRSHLREVCWTPEGWDKAYQEQGGVCAICGVGFGDSIGRKLHADHNHQNKTPRGLLCGECNFMLGKAKENPNILEAGAKYLRKYSDAPKKNN